MGHPILNECLSSGAIDRGIDAGQLIGPEAADFLEDAAGLWNDRNRQVASGAVRGALMGFASGGYPGAVLGGASGGYAASQPRPAAKQPAATQKDGSPSSPVPNPAALQLLAAMLRPEVVDALAAMVLGRQGAATIPVAGTDVPVGAFASMVQQLASQASVQNHQLKGGTAAESWTESLGEFGIEDPAEHSFVLLELLSEAALDDELYDGELYDGEPTETVFDEDEGMAMEWLESWPWRRR